MTPGTNYQYFLNVERDPRFVGICPMGTGDVFEIPYRHYWELEHFKKMAPKKNGLKILGVGCGAGRWGISLAENGAFYVGIDVSPPQLNIARKSALTAGIESIMFIEVSILDYCPPEGQFFDIISCEGVLQYLTDDQVLLFLTRAKNWLCNDGIIIDRSTVIRDSTRYEKADDEYFCIYRTGKELCTMFEKAGFVSAYQKRTYTYLRMGFLWKIRPVRYLFAHGMNVFPLTTFTTMRALSILVELLIGESGLEPDGRFYSHEFFAFALRKEAK